MAAPQRSNKEAYEATRRKITKRGKPVEPPTFNEATLRAFEGLSTKGFDEVHNYTTEGGYTFHVSKHQYNDGTTVSYSVTLTYDSDLDPTTR